LKAKKILKMKQETFLSQDIQISLAVLRYKEIFIFS